MTSLEERRAGKAARDARYRAKRRAEAAALVAPAHVAPADYRNLSDEELDRALNRAERAAEEYRLHVWPFRWRAHEGIDASVEGARERLFALLGNNRLDLTHPAMLPLIPAGIADAWVLANVPEVSEAWHRAIDSGDDIWDPRHDKAEFDREFARLRGEVAALTVEQRRRAAVIARARAEAALKEAEAALSAVDSHGEG